uniref:Uncharacterized protein n=1 Tax=Romanomermis culicivorax TaxID=13658 RepID=A0A915J8X4_ROMCU
LGEVVLDIAVPTDTQQIQAFAVEQCLCPEGYQGLSCEECAPGYERSGGGLYLGTCVKAVERDISRCSEIGSISPETDPSGLCVCKEYVTGPTCTQCKAQSYYLTAHHPSGCIPCFCSGVTKECESSNFFKSQIVLSTSNSSIVDIRPTVDGNRRLSVQDLESSNGRALYLELPRQFLGNKITSYGGFLKVGFQCSGDGSADRHTNIIIRGNDISLHFKPQVEVKPGADNMIDAQFFEDSWIREDGLDSTREHLLMTLADLHTILVKATCFERTESFSLSELTMDYAVPQQVSHDRALTVEQCRCPPGYIGTSCEDCAAGYTRTGGGLYLGLCEPCECHGHADTCDPELGQCIDCKHNTYGPRCELCKPPFKGDATRGTPHDCDDGSRPRCTHCQCYNHSPRGCDDNCRCVRCEHNTEG